MKVTQENPQAFKPVTITLETWEELYALWHTLVNVDFDLENTNDLISAKLYEELDNILYP